MGKQYRKLEQRDIEFIKIQKMFYIASTSGQEVNLSPKGYDTIRVLDESTLLFASLPGSGNRTYRDAVNDGEFTLLFNAFEGAPLILRLFCKTEIIEESDKRYHSYLEYFNLRKGIIRNLFLFHIYAVESSCGMSVPYMEYKGERDELKEWAVDMNRRDQLNEYNDKHFTPPDLSKLN
ncbi:pyridoxamine 5'-phosphate oxidase family protein [Sulfurovum sp. zt1-1]|uniref:Pyridoxamine 5'-phosphate oxidase family protein n=1 Tax=Sulfurovum zhangzhouensis TaxID=3019067 RepID=A0ABT7QY97_9BACT|nr:pyridoxamine 5'-phosphate oxidase family protein [Sulfurovum zhangzhouensis]MDM5271796.1 pyridoxamine 5'-phosphate oxidase family protein [Sulfurovum zhangzhouensis]